MGDQLPPSGLPDGQVPGVPSDNTTLMEVLQEMAAQGYTEDFHSTESGDLRCPRCGTSIPASETTIDAQRRLEGASDPADEQLVLAVRCAICGAKGTVVLGYGPNASDADIAVMAALGG
ncbi:MAG: hypothetical protein JWM05_3787 [Acidimicrobiales bacterium]|nr:hypothetical protein [Acidimicrobiales bacterium]